MMSRFSRRMTSCRPRLIRLSTILILASVFVLGQASPPPCSDTGAAFGGPMAALKPADVLLAILSPRAGETMPEYMPDESVTVTVDYWGPRLLGAKSARKVDDYHLVFFLDVDDAPYVGSLSAVPRCNSSIVHSDTTRATFAHVMHGAHTLSVMLVGSNDISVN